MISTVDPQARHGRKTAAHAFDGYKGHIAIDPDSEVITATTVTAGNTGDATSAGDLLARDLPTQDVPAADVASGGDDPCDQVSTAHGQDTADNPTETETGEMEAPLAVYGDAAYGAGVLLEKLEAAGADIMTKVQPPVAPGGRFSKDAFTVDTGAGTVTCPAHVTVPIKPAKAGGSTAALADRLRRLPVGRRVHDREDRAHHQHRPLRGRADPGPYHPAGPRLAGRVPGHPTKGRAQARAPDAPPAWRAAGPSPRSDQSRRRLLVTSSRNESGPVRRTRTHRGGRAKLGSRHQLNPTREPSEPMTGLTWHCRRIPTTHNSQKTQCHQQDWQAATNR